MKQIKNIQVIRGLAIIAVVVIHTIPRGEWQVFCRPFVNFAVAAFVFLSGYLTHEEDNWLPVCRRRIRRVLIPYVLWSLIYCFPLLAEGHFFNFIIRLATAKTCSPFYYIFVYIQLVILTPYIFKLAKSSYRILGWLVTPIFIIISLYFPRLSIIQSNSYLDVICNDLCLGWFCFYFLGLILGNRLFNNHTKSILVKLSGIRLISKKDDSEKPQIWYNALIILYVISLGLQMFEIDIWYQVGVSNCGSQCNLTAIFSSILFSIMIYRFVNQGITPPRLDNLKTNQSGSNYFVVFQYHKSRHIISMILLSIGNYSFGIYLCHVLVIIVLDHTSFYNRIPIMLNSIVVIIISYMLCYLLSRVFGSRCSHILGLE